MSNEPPSKRAISSWRLSGAAFIALLSRQCSPDALGHASWFLVPLDFHREPGDDLVPTSPNVIDRNHFRARPHARAGRDRRREADLVPPVVDAQRKALGADQVPPEAVDHRQREVAV